MARWKDLGHENPHQLLLRIDPEARVVETAPTRAAFRWRHLVALARVVASEYGFPAPGYKQACELLKV